MRKLIRKIHGFPCDKQGTSAIEFAIVAPIFFLMMFSTFEVGWFYFVNSTLDAATISASRFVRTGQSQNNGLTKQDFFTLVCPTLDLFGECTTNLTVEVKQFNTFADLAADVTPAVCRGDDQNAIDNLAFEPGVDNQIIRLRFCLLYRPINPSIGINLSSTDGAARRLVSTFIFRNEPFSKN